MARIVVLVADAQLLFCDSLARALAGYAELDVLSDRPLTAVDTIKAVVARQSDVVLIDHWLYGMEAQAVTRAILARSPATRVIHLSALHAPQFIEEALDAGAAGFLPKSIDVEGIREAIHRAHAGESPVFEQELSRFVAKLESQRTLVDLTWRRLSTLTPRELEILQLLGAGRTVEEIASRLGISSPTVRTHVHRILSKTGTRSQIEAVAVARDYGLVLP